MCRSPQVSGSRAGVLTRSGANRAVVIARGHPLPAPLWLQLPFSACSPGLTGGFVGPAARCASRFSPCARCLLACTGLLVLLAAARDNTLWPKCPLAARLCRNNPGQSSRRRASFAFLRNGLKSPLTALPLALPLASWPRSVGVVVSLARRCRASLRHL